MVTEPDRYPKQQIGSHKQKLTPNMSRKGISISCTSTVQFKVAHVFIVIEATHFVTIQEQDIHHYINTITLIQFSTDNLMKFTC